MSGVHVSESTVPTRARSPCGPIGDGKSTPKQRQAASPHPAPTDDRRSGKDIAESFVKGRITNPLLRAKSSP